MADIKKEIADVKAAVSGIAPALTALSQAVTDAVAKIQGAVDPDPDGVLEAQVSVLNEAAASMTDLATKLEAVAAPAAPPTEGQKA